MGMTNHKLMAAFAGIAVLLAAAGGCGPKKDELTTPGAKPLEPP